MNPLWLVGGAAALLALIFAPRARASETPPVPTSKPRDGVRGIRNNNPFNLRPGDSWQGLADPPDDGAGYLVFTTAFYGLRAGYINLRNQQVKHGLNTLRAILTKYAPPEENDTAAYINAVASEMNTTADAPLDLVHMPEDLLDFGAAVIHHENGAQPYTYDELSAAVRAAGGNT